MQGEKDSVGAGGILRRIGPAFIVGATIIGPGSITLMSKTGSLYGYSMLWVSVLAGVLMACFIALFMRLGILADDTFLGLTAKRFGRWYAILCGVGVFGIAAAFQFGNCMGVTAAMDLLVGGVPKYVWPIAFTAAAIAFMFLFKRIYFIIEKMMTVLLILMLAAFAANLVWARPNLLGILKGLAVPSIPEGLDWLTIGGLVATTFSIAGAFFQCYLVKAKGWGERDLRSGITDTILGSVILTMIGAVIMMTAATVLHPRGIEVTSATDMATQLEGVFGAGAKYVFCFGFWAAAFSSFVSNAIVGGVMANDGLGMGGKIDSGATKAFATLVLLTGLGVALGIIIGAAEAGSEVLIKAIVVGQAATLVAVPLCTIAMVVVLFDRRATGGRGLPLWGQVIVPIGAVVLIGICARTLLSLSQKL